MTRCDWICFTALILAIIGAFLLGASWGYRIGVERPCKPIVVSELSQKDRETGREFFCEEKFAHGGWQIHPAFQALYWLPIPPLPGREES